MEELSTLAKRLRDARDKCDMTQTEVAKKVGISQASYAFYETGRKEPRIENLIKLADLFHTSIDYLVGRY